MLTGLKVYRLSIAMLGNADVAAVIDMYASAVANWCLPVWQERQRRTTRDEDNQWRGNDDAQKSDANQRRAVRSRCADGEKPTHRRAAATKEPHINMATKGIPTTICK